ncbi:MAG: PD-(D/E)XK nuclease family protein [Acidobacteria bacterium]|nr:PD-(D/E)XK nuclease family protein [Acidobacteriota bacterium]
MSAGQIIEAARAGGAILTANQRLSRTLREQYDRAQAAAGLRAWESPAILPFSTWLASQWGDALLGGGVAPRTVLSAAQEESVWRTIVAASPDAQSLLDLRGAAQSAMEAWRLIQQYRVPLDARFNAQEDQAAFHAWAVEYARLCREHGWLDGVRLADAVRPALRGPGAILLAGFDEFTPQQEDVLNTLRASGCAVTVAEAAGIEARVARRGCLDADDELRCAALWARERLDAGAGSIAVVLLNLGVRRTRIERIFGEILPGAFHISIPEPLGDYPVVHAALLALRLAVVQRWTLADAGSLLRSPFLAGGVTEAEARAMLDARLRRWRRSHVAAQSVEAQAQDCPRLAAALAAWRSIPFAGAHTAAEWAAIFRQALDAAGWPGDAALSSVEYQAAEAWAGLFQTFSSLDAVAGPMPCGAAVARLADLADAARFQPQDTGAPVQIMGVLEAAGSRFDALWIAGASDQVWPAPSHPHPFLPLGVQRELGLPHSSPEREEEFARRTFARLRSSAPVVVVSWPMRAGDVELRPSPLIDGVRDDAEPARATATRKAAEIEMLDDEAGPPLEGNRPRGGTRVVKLQSICPFQAFADLRLGARPLDSADLGLSALERGSAVHLALQLFWEQVCDHATLAAMTDADLRAAAEGTARGALERPFRDARQPFDVRFRELETRRLTDVLMRQAEFERTRAPFRVASHERERLIEIGGLELEARIDRVDEFPDGRQAIIDYKTTAPSTAAWFGDRPDEPQLPLYAISNDAPVAGVAFAAVGADGPAFRGYAAAEDLLPGAKPFPRPAADQLADWRRVLTPIAEAFRAGGAEVDPKSKAVCAQCGLAPLCRIHEAAPAEVEDAEEPA